MNYALCVLGGDITQGASGKWRTLGPEDSGDKHGLCNDRWRIEAAKALYASHLPGLGSPGLIWVSGGCSNLPDREWYPSIASVMRDELIAEGVPTSMLKADERSENTLQQLEALQECRRQWSISRNDIPITVILSNEWHLPCIDSLIEHRPSISSLKMDLEAGELLLLGAEAVLSSFEPLTWCHRVVRVRSDPRMADRLAAEARGIKAIRDGTYGETSFGV